MSQGAVILPALAQMALEQSQPAIYDRPIGLRLLFQDPATGAEHYLVRYSARTAAQPHTHTASHTIIVLEGRLQANGQILGPGSYCHFPAGLVMHHGPTRDEDCLFVTIFHGPFDVHPAQ
ncbi:cupin domain-containing protein [Streptomyces sp. NPDC020681]|uniref:cupin domain-containing protein n=1 Tax=Streptomyces sp. NPDC020681 TaxID=3365083 RepID=UPI003789919F